MYNQQQQYNQPGMVPMQQYHPQQQQQYDQQQQYNQQYNQQQGIQYEQQPVATGHMPITAHMTPMGGASSSSPPLNNDPMIDGLSFFPSLVVKQKRNSLWEYLCNCEEENKYDIFNPEGPGSHKEKILTAKEKSGYCTRMCLAEKRHFNMSIKTANDEEALYFERPYRIMERGGWCCCCCACGFQALRVYSGDASKSPDTMLGYVQEDYYCLFPTLSVFDDSGNLAYKIKLKPSCQSFCCAFAKATFEIFEASDEGCKNQVGKIKKKWSGALKEIFTDADNFFIEFPKNATAKQRAVLLGALFFMDYLYYEDGGCHILHCLGAPLTGPCACLAWCCNFNSSDSGNSGLLL